MVSWHPGDLNQVTRATTLANNSAKFRFHGVSAHAAAAPDQGRSALDGVEAMNAMVNLMREHVPQETRIHYIITSGGKAPNVVPDFAEVYYYARHSDMRVLDGIWERILNAAKGAALGTGTTMDLELVNSVYNVLPNDALADVMQSALERVGGYSYTPDETAFATQIRTSLTGTLPPPDAATRVIPPETGVSPGVDRHGRSQLGGAHGAALRGNLGARNAGPQLAGGGGWWDVDRLERDDGGRQDDGPDRDRAVQQPRPPGEGARGIRQTAGRIRLQVASGRPEAAAGLQAVTREM